MIHEIARHNGHNIVRDKLLEELKELYEAVEANDDMAILEESADVSIMIDQWLILNHNRYEHNEMRHYKILRTCERLGICNTDIMANIDKRFEKGLEE